MREISNDSSLEFVEKSSLKNKKLINFLTLCYPLIVDFQNVENLSGRWSACFNSSDLTRYSVFFLFMFYLINK